MLQPEDQTMIEGCPVVEQHDLSDEIHAALRVVYSGRYVTYLPLSVVTLTSRRAFNSREPQTFPTLRAML